MMSIAGEADRAVIVGAGLDDVDAPSEANEWMSDLDRQCKSRED